MCEAQERNTRAVFELRGMATEWRVDVPRILQILAGTDCRHEQPATAEKTESTETD